ncbi:unnamed protein product [Rhodiola kirilowii]
MECNKDEAIRAKEIAERKMLNNDFAGAKKFALKAQQLYANLDNISMILAVCEVHCSALNNMMGPTNVNWYDVLQIEKMADETTIKKQYRKLALLLHPDKNKFAGAEAAFKLIGEASRVLSNKITRSAFDLKIKASMKTSTSTKPPSHPTSGSSSVNKHQNTQANFRDFVNKKSTMNDPRQKSHIFQQGSDTFWTRCPCCRTSFEYNKLVLRRQLCCQTCRTTFIAYETEAPITQANANSSQPNSVSGKSSHKGPEGADMATEINGRSNGHSVHNSMSAPPTKAGLSDSNSKQKVNDVEGVNLDAQKKGPKSDVTKPVMAKASRNTSKKRGRRVVVESSQSSDGVRDDDVGVEVNQENDYTKPEGSYDAKRSCRNKTNVSYTEGLYDNCEFVKLPKMPETVHWDNKNKYKAHTGMGLENDHGSAFATSMNVVEKVNHNTETSHKENVANKKRNLKKQTTSGFEEDIVDLSDEKDAEADTEQDVFPASYDCLDPQFSDFDKDKQKCCFDVDQIWAVYDTVDAMPRFYARVREVCSPDFKLRITWLEPYARGESNTKWIDAGLPAACGMFKYGNTEDTTEYLTFSHQMRFEIGKNRNSFVIYPRAREVWALFRNWDIGWANDPEKHMPFKFEFVVILSDFNQKESVEVAYLKKLRGFVSLFQQTPHEGKSSFRIPPGNLFQFSHRIPSFQMSGSERDDVPQGSYELDTAGLPSDIDDLDFTESEMESENKDTAGDVLIKQSTESREKPSTVPGSVEINGSSKTCSLDDANQGSTKVMDIKDIPKEAQSCHKSGTAASNQDDDCIVITPRKPTTVIRRSPRVSLSKKNNNLNIT